MASLSRLRRGGGGGRYREPERREGRLCVLMELCDGGCVAALLRNYGALRWNIVARSPPPHCVTTACCYTRYDSMLLHSAYSAARHGAYDWVAHIYILHQCSGLPVPRILFSCTRLSLHQPPCYVGAYARRTPRTHPSLSRAADGRHTTCGAEGLGYLHRVGLTHGNLRPSNLLVR